MSKSEKKPKSSDTAKRVCLKCQKKFISLSKFNRICKDCTEKQPRLPTTIQHKSRRKLKPLKSENINK